MILTMHNIQYSVLTNLIIKQYILVNGNSDSDMEEVNNYGMMAVNMKGIGKIT